MKPPSNNSHITGPQAFIGGPSTGQIGGQPVRVVEVVGPAKRTHQTEARITLRLPNRVEVNREALRVMGLAVGSPIELISPRRNGGKQWLLDTRAQAPARLVENKGLHSFRTAAPPDRRLPIAGTIHPTRAAFDIGPQLMESVCVQLPDGRRVCEQRGTGVFVLLPRRA